MITKNVGKKLKKMLEVVDHSLLIGPQKVWVSDNLVVPKIIMWDMMIQAFPNSEVKEWQCTLTRFYKKWTGLARSAETSVFFRDRKHQGYGLKELPRVNESQQIVKWLLMKESSDPQARKIFKRRLKKDAEGEIGRGRKDSICLKIKKLEAMVDFEEMRGPIRKAGSKKGLRVAAKMTRRKNILKAYKNDQEEKRIVPLHGFQMQANWLVWSPVLGREMEKSTEWGKVMTSYSARLWKFVLNAGLNTLPSPDNLKRWNVKKGKEFKCGLCSKTYVTAAHILAGCPYVLKKENKASGTDRYTWRHNSVLSVIRKHLKKKIQHVNSLSKKRTPVGKKKVVFVKEGQKLKPGPEHDKTQKSLGLLEKATDWTFDFHLSEERKRPYQMDQKVCATSFTPDGYIVSHDEKICTVIELTCPMEENMDKWHKKKKEKYEEELKSEGYSMRYLIVEVGARGGLPTTLKREMRKMGLTKNEANSVVDECVLMARRCSFVIWCQRFNPEFIATEMKI